MSTDDPELEAAQSDRIGQVIAGKYLLEREIGSGGMGVVYKAYRSDLQAHVALKLLRPSFMSDPQVAGRFLQEARTAANLKSPHIARVQDFGVLEDDPSGARPFIVMEYLTGEDLGEVLKAGELPVGDAVDYIIQACHGIAEAHSLGIVHRDLKPANLFRHDRNSIKVLDFGIAKPGDAPVSRLTKAGLSIGSPHYMSPEQIERPRYVDGRADIYSFGICLYEILTCRVPFNGETYGELASNILRGDAFRLEQLRPDLPHGLAEIVQRAFAREAGERFQRIEELVSALAPYSLPRTRRLVELLSVGPLPTPTDFVMPLPSTPPVASNLSNSQSAPPPAEQGRKRGKPMVWATLALLLIVLFTTAGILSQGKRSTSGVLTPAPGAAPAAAVFAPAQPALAAEASDPAALAHSPAAPAPLAERTASTGKHKLRAAAAERPVAVVSPVAEPKLNLESRSRQ
jgi:eukaryotic-like serine/threonine-protein kinase